MELLPFVGVCLDSPPLHRPLPPPPSSPISQWAPLFLAFLFVCSNLPDISHASCLLLISLLTVAFLSVHVCLPDTVGRWEGENWLLCFALQKLLPATVLALACSYRGERRDRRCYLAHCRVADRKREIELEEQVRSVVCVMILGILYSIYNNIEYTTTLPYNVVCIGY